MKNEHFNLALVTGASSGIGEAVARLLADKGINLVIHGRNQSNLEQLALELGKKVTVDIVIADLALSQGRIKVFDVIRKRIPDLVINNAGFGAYGDAIAYDTKSQTDILTVNCQAVLELTLESAKAMIAANRKGVILNVSSVAGKLPIAPGFAVYAASKAFINSLSPSLDYELQKNGVRVLTSCPGVVLTNFRDRAGGRRDLGSKELEMTSDFAAKEIWQQIVAQKLIHVFNWKYQLLAWFSHIVPKALLAKTMYSKFTNTPKKNGTK